MATGPGLTLQRQLAAPPALVFAALIEPSRMLRWFGPARAEVAGAETDPRVGGAYRVVMVMPEGDEHVVSGIYREIVPDERLVFTWAWRSTPGQQSLVTIELRARGTGTLLTLTHARLPDEATRASHAEGWSEALARLARAVA